MAGWTDGEDGAGGGARRVRAGTRGGIGVIFQKELLDILRDRRALFFAFVVPFCLYPITFLAFSGLSHRSEKEGPLQVGISGDYLDFLPYLADREIVVTKAEDGHPLPDSVRKGELALFLEFARGEEPQSAAPAGGVGEPPGEEEVSPCREAVTLYHSSTSPSSVEARHRIEKALDAYKSALVAKRFDVLGMPVDPERMVVVEVSNVALAGEQSAARFAPFLPILLVMLLLTGGSFAAIDLVAGEKERGTLETLYIHPIPVRSIVWGKFLVVLVISIVSVIVNLAGLALSWALGFAPEGLDNLPIEAPRLLTLLAVILLVAPLAILTSAVLLGVSAYARSFREAQTYLLPLLLVSLVATFLASSPQVTLSSAVVVVPLANVALAIRKAVEGELDAVSFLVVFGSSAVYAWAALWKTSRLLEKEEVVLNLEPPSLAGEWNTDGRARRAILFGWLMLLFLHFAAAWAQAKDPRGGLAVTLWVFVLIPALAYPLIARVPFRETLGLRAPHPSSWLLAVPVAVSAFLVIAFYQSLQSLFLPFPREMEEAFRNFFEGDGSHRGLALILFAVSPGICEELLWRGAFQGDLEPRARTTRTVITVGLFFGLFHMDAYRLVPTGLMGVILAVVRHRTGSIFPCMLIHTLYNSVGLLAFFRGLDKEGSALTRTVESPVTAAAALAILVITLRAFRPPAARPE
jgi:sodium transport system permease protein